MTRQEMAEIIQAVVDAEAKAGGRGDCYEFPEDQVEALKDLGLPMIRTNPKYIVAGVLEDLEAAGFRVFRPADCDTTKASGCRGGGRRSEGEFWLVPKEDL